MNNIRRRIKEEAPVNPKDAIKLELEAHKKAIGEARNITALIPLFRSAYTYISANVDGKNNNLKNMFDSGYIPMAIATTAYLNHLESSIGSMQMRTDVFKVALRNLKKGASETIDAIINTL